MRKISRDVITSLGFGNWIATARLLSFITSPMAHCKNFASCFALRLPAGRRTLMGLASLWATSTFAIWTREGSTLSHSYSDGDASRTAALLAAFPPALWNSLNLTSRGGMKGAMGPSTRFPAPTVSLSICRWPSCAASCAILKLLGPLVNIQCPATTYRPAYL